MTRGFDPIDWRGHWIAPELLVDPDHLPDGFEPPMPVRGFSRVLYRKVLDLHGWGALHEDLHALSRRQKWDEMTDAVDDEVLRAFAVVGEPEQVAAELLARYGDITTRSSCYAPYRADPERWGRVFTALKTG